MLLKVHLTYEKSDHLLNLGCHILAAEERLEDLEWRRFSALGATRSGCALL